jgi:hypothetical protein
LTVLSDDVKKDGESLKMNVAQRNRLVRTLVVRGVMGMVGILFTYGGVGQADEVNFGRDIRPILSDRCFRCHGPNEDDRQAHLRLDQADGEQGAYRTHEGTTAIAPNNLQKSELWRRITAEDEDERMPPADSQKKALSPDEQELFKKWIQQGAKFQTFWAFVPPVTSPPAQVKKPAWRNGPIDRRVMAELEHKSKSLVPKDEADRRTLIRRLTFDLTGLPPTWWRSMNSFVTIRQTRTPPWWIG